MHSERLGQRPPRDIQRQRPTRQQGRSFDMHLPKLERKPWGNVLGWGGHPFPQANTYQ